MQKHVTLRRRAEAWARTVQGDDGYVDTSKFVVPWLAYTTLRKDVSVLDSDLSRGT